jgi:hypothetical protein
MTVIHIEQHMKHHNGKPQSLKQDLHIKTG